MAGLTGPFTFQNPAQNKMDDRSFTVEVMCAIADPVLLSLSRGELKKNMPVQCKPGQENSRQQVTYLEAFGRLMAGMGPWLELDHDGSP